MPAVYWAPWTKASREVTSRQVYISVCCHGCAVAQRGQESPLPDHGNYLVVELFVRRLIHLNTDRYALFIDLKTDPNGAGWSNLGLSGLRR